MAVEKHPAASPADLVAGAVDDQAAGRQSCPHQRPRLVDGVLRVLPQHVEGPHQHRAVAGQLEAAETELDGVAHGCAGGPYALRIDLQADHPHIGAHRVQPAGQLEGGHRQRAVAEIDHQRLGGRLQRGADPRRVHKPAVAAAQPVVARRAPRQLSDRGDHDLNFRASSAVYPDPRGAAGDGT